MPFVKVQKNKAYFKRFQTKYRRRRENKTDYRARKRLVTQDKNKYNSPKYRFVVRFTNTDVICQIIYAKLNGDTVLSSAYARELKNFGMPVQLKNYAAAYATGLLLARRLLTQLKLADKYPGQTKVSGEDFNVSELSDGPRPFRALLDVGLRRTTTGAKVFAALKGATDGGLDIPHSDRRFVGFDSGEKKLKPDVLRKYIFGGHVGDYMKSLNEEDADTFKARFSKYVKAGIKAEELQGRWEKVHAAIRANPARKASGKQKPAKHIKHKGFEAPRSIEQRKSRIRQILANRAKSGGDQ